MGAGPEQVVTGCNTVDINVRHAGILLAIDQNDLSKREKWIL